MSTETITEPKLDDAPPCWPPVAHIIHKSQQPAKEGTIALCGVKLMGIDLGRLGTNTNRCKKCEAEMQRRLRKENL